MGIRWQDLSEAQKSLIEGEPVEPSHPRAQILRRPRLERDEQRIFANWCLLNGLPFCWHATHRRSTATKGVSDFWVGKNGQSIWLEFKSLPIRISAEQIKFQELLSRESIKWAVVQSADEAIRLIKKL